MGGQAEMPAPPVPHPGSYSWTAPQRLTPENTCDGYNIHRGPYRGGQHGCGFPPPGTKACARLELTGVRVAAPPGGSAGAMGPSSPRVVPMRRRLNGRLLV